MILIAAAKTMIDDQIEVLNNLDDLTIDILTILRKISKEEMGILFKIKGNTLDKTYKYYQDFNSTNYAINKYNGVVFKELKDKTNINAYKDVYILSALYGIVSATDKISSYRLDFNSNKIVGFNLYKYWDTYIKDFINKQNPKMILNLCSNEYFKALNKDIINKYKIISIECNKKLPSATIKKVRGNILNYVVENKVTDYTTLKNKETNLVKFIDLKEDKLIFELKE